MDDLKKAVEDGSREILVNHLSGAARTFFLSSLLTDLERPCLLVLPSAKDAAQFYRELVFFLPGSLTGSLPEERRLYDFPVYDISPLAGLSPHRDVISRRLQALYVLISGKNPIVVTSVETLLLKILPKEMMIQGVELLEPEEEFDREDLLRKLEANGYSRTSLVEERGDYSVRGGVIDVFPPLYPQPVRLEFWGDRLESIRHFETLSQRSTGLLKECVLLPSSEIIMDSGTMTRARSMGRIPMPAGEGGSFPGQEAWLNHFYSRLDTVFDYLPEKSLLIRLDPLRMEKEAKKFAEKFLKDTEKYGEGAFESGRPFPELENILFSYEEMTPLFEARQRIDFSELPVGGGEEGAAVLNVEGVSGVDDGLDIRMAGRGKVSMAPLADRVSGWLRSGSRVVLVCRTEQQAQRLKEILSNYRVDVIEVTADWHGVNRRKGLSICLGRLTRGFSWPETGIHLISEDEIFGPKRSRASSKKGLEGEGLAWSGLSHLKIGDLVVHQDHGIGRYGGLSKMEVEQKVNDFVVIEYAGTDRLYIPADRISVLQKYLGADESDPRLDQLGGRSWDLVKKKAKKSIREIAKQLVEIYALRKHRKGFAFSRSDNAFREFEATFEHEETSDQIKTIDQVLSDMESDRPMDRLVCGDVGFGKTEVAIRAAFKAVSDGKQVALLVPTTVLAEQHYGTFNKRMKPYSIKTAVVSRFKTRNEQKEILARVRAGKVDVLIGTHRLLQKDVKFRDLGLLIIDEEQRFGVKQKETLKKYRALVDVLALTATPIPRTFHLSLMGIRDLSVIETPPEDRLAIQTYLSKYDEPTIARAIESEMERGGQVFFVHNRVQTIDNMAARLKALVPGARYAVAHGQMKEKELEETMVRFLNREIDVLVCTTIIESGLDIPSANTIIINEADRFGLSQIYQLRGRVGRADENAYAYLFISGGSELTRDAEKRLRALMDFTRLGAGIHLAMHDLKIRGGGNILGFSQAGHISAIGYELYLKLIEQNVAELKGEEWHEEVNPEINVNLAAYLPGHYVSDTDVRLNLYRRLSTMKEEGELQAMIEEMNDRFGPQPEEVSNLMLVMSVRLLLKKMGVPRLDIARDGLLFTFSEDSIMDRERLVALVSRHRNRYGFLPGLKLKVRTHGLSPKEGLTKAAEAIQELGHGGRE
ncbi:MAG: transcription-repair coupling factor [Pseudomonadota bacterium]